MTPEEAEALDITPEERGLLKRALVLAPRMHAGQTWGDGAPYSAHLDAVVRILTEYGADGTQLVAGELHDIVEDTPLDLDGVRAMFGEPVARLVGLLTEPPGKNRADRHAEAYPRIRQDPRAVMIKLADRIANVERGRQTGGPSLRMYQEENAEFERALRRLGEFDAMWERLNRGVKGGG
jgi:(p)ppGpp synthase/HD superfamily hydrolase